MLNSILLHNNRLSYNEFIIFVSLVKSLLSAVIPLEFIESSQHHYIQLVFVVV